MSKMVFRKTDLQTLKPGDFQLFAKTLSATDAMLYAGLSGEVSPLYLNETFAADTKLRGQTVPPMLVAGMAGGAIYRLLSPAVLTESRTFHFLKAVFVGDTVTARAKVLSVDRESGRVRVSVDCYNQREEKVMESECLETLLFPEEKGE